MAGGDWVAASLTQVLWLGGCRCGHRRRLRAVCSDARRDGPGDDRQDGGEEGVAKRAAIARPADDGQECDKERGRANQPHDASPAGKDPVRRVSSPADIREAAKPTAATRKGPAAAVVTALLTTGLALAPSELAAASVTNAIVMPTMPVRHPRTRRGPVVQSREPETPHFRACSEPPP